MNPQQLKKQLSSQYRLICFQDLAEVSRSPFYVYKLFYQLYKSEYKPDERLVFYSGETPGKKLIQHLYQAASLIDISNFFIMIVAPDIQSVVEKNVLHSGDGVCFNFLQIQIDDCVALENNFALPETLCPLPWMHMEVDISGKVAPCCAYNGSLAQIHDQSLTETFENKRMQEIRKCFLDGKKHASCDACWVMEDQGITSLRQRHMKLLGREFLGNRIHNPQITSLDIKPSNACNFKCRICGPGGSSLHAAEQAKANNIIAKQSSSHVDILFNQELPHLIENLENLDFYGGEPFYIKQILNFVEECKQNGHAEHLRLHFNTNGSVYPERIENCWKHYQQIDIQFSIDDIGKRFELQRGGSWTQVESNIKRFIDLQLPNMTLGIMPAIGIMNVFYIDELFKWAETLGLPISPIMIEKPVEFAFISLTEQAKDAILEKYKDSDHKEIQKFSNIISNTEINHNRAEKFRNKIQYYDRIRNESFQTSHYEIAKLMGMC